MMLIPIKELSLGILKDDKPVETEILVNPDHIVTVQQYRGKDHFVMTVASTVEGESEYFNISAEQYEILKRRFVNQ